MEIESRCVSCNKIKTLNSWYVCSDCWSKHFMSNDDWETSDRNTEKYNAKLKEAKTLNSFLKLSLIKKWDAIIFGDGAGSGWDGPIGWSSLIIDKFSGTRKVLFGCNSSGTVNMAELLPYTTSLKYYEAKMKRKEVLEPIIHIVSDSNITVGCGSGKFKAKANKDLWGVIDHFTELGYCLYWHWIPRDTVALQIVADKIATAARKSVEKVTVDENKIYEILPYK